MFVSLGGLEILYVQLQVEGKVLGNFDLVAILPSSASGTSLVYQSTANSIKTIDGKTAFTNQLTSFSSSAKFNPSDNIMPNFPTDTKKLMSHFNR